MKKILFAISLGTLLLGGPALGQGAPQTVKICIPTSGTTCPPVTASAPLPVTGSFAATLSGFTPNGNYGTLTATAATSASTAMPAGTSVAFQNTSTVDVSCVLSSGAATATTNKTIVRGGSTVFLTVGSNTNAACINQTGSASNVIVMAGGTGLGTNFGGGSGGGGGGGAVTLASGAVASGAYSSGSIASGAYASGSIGSGAMVDLGAIADAASTAGGTGSVNAKLRLMTTQLGTINTTLGSPFQAGGSIGNTTFASTQSGTWNITNISGTVSLPTGAATAAKQPALGTAGTPSADVITVQGVTSMTPLASNITQVLGAANSATNGLFVRTGSGQIASGSFASGSIASGAYASGSIGAGAVAAGAYVSGSILSGALASGAVVDITNMSGTTAAAVPSKAIYNGVNIGGNIVGLTGIATGATVKAATVAIVDASGNQITAFGGSGGTASNYGSAFPTTGTAIGFSDGTNMVAGRVTTYGTAPTGLPAIAVNANVTNTNANGSATSANSSPVVIASDQAAVKVSPQAITTGGSSTTGNIAANNTTAVVVKGSAGTLYGVQVYGIGSAPAYLKIYNAASATCGSGTPVKRLMIPAAATAANGAGSNITFGPAGVAFGTGITYCVTTGIGDSDTTAPAASTFLVNLDWQ